MIVVVIIIIIIIIILVITCMQDVYSYVPETNCVSMVHIECCSCSVVQFMLHVMLLLLLLDKQLVSSNLSIHTYMVLNLQL
jgi:hypothetical protein